MIFFFLLIFENYDVASQEYEFNHIRISVFQRSRSFSFVINRAVSLFLSMIR